MNFDGLNIFVFPGKTVTSSATSASTILPLTAANKIPRYCRLQSTGFLYVRFGVGATSATTNDILVSPNEALILNTNQATHIGYLEETPGAKLNIMVVDS